MNTVYLKASALSILLVVLIIYCIQILDLKGEIEHDIKVVMLGNKLLQHKKNSLSNKIKNLENYNAVFAKAMANDGVQNLIFAIKDKYDELYDFQFEVVPQNNINCIHSDDNKCLLHVRLQISFTYTNYEQAFGLVQELLGIREVAVEKILLKQLEGNKKLTNLVLKSYYK